MQVNCEFCDQSLKSKVREPFDKFHVGRVICPSCAKENKRYLSEYDLLLYFVGSTLIYSIAVVVINYVLTYYLITHLYISLLVFFLILCAGYFLSDFFAKYIYLQAPKKKIWKNHDFKEDRVPITRRLNIQFMLFIFVSFLHVSQPELSYYNVFLLFLVILFSSSKTYLAYKSEVKALPKNLKSKIKTG